MNDTNHIELRNWIRAEMDKPDRMWSQARLAERAHLSQTQISRVLNGEIPVTDNFCRRIAKAFHVRPERVLVMAGLSDQPSEEETPPELKALWLRIKRFPPLGQQVIFGACDSVVTAAEVAYQTTRPVAY